MRKLLLLVAVFLIVSAYGQKAEPLLKNNSDNTLLWRISGKDLKSPSYLFGTFHLLCKEDIHFSDQLKTAISRSDIVYMEMKMDDPSVMLGGIMYMNMKDGKTLKDLYTEKEYERLEKVFRDSLKTPLMMFQKMKPYFLMSLFYPKMMDCKSPTGVEMELMKVIKDDNKEIKGFETIRFQSSVFDSIPYEWQAKELLKSVDSADRMKQEFYTILNLYKDQKLDSIGIRTTESEFSDDKYGKILLTNRNENWVAQLDKIMRVQSVFTAVGAGHLPGKDGLISLLRKMGYQVDPLKN